MHSKSTLSRRFPTALAVAATALLALPASGMASETFGSRLVNSPNYGSCDDTPSPLTAPCSWVSYIHPSAPDGDPYTGGAPNDGVITKFRIRANGPGASVTFRVANLTLAPPDSALASAVGTGPTVTIAGLGEIEEFSGRVPVKKGNQLAIDTSDADAIYETGGNEFSYGYGPALVDGGAARSSSEAHGELLVAATVESDADGDGYGDETQDRCVNQAGSGDGCPTPEEAAARAKPVLTALAVTPKAAKGARKLRYRLSKAAKVTLRVERVGKGRRAGGKCRKQTAANRARKACKRYVKLPGRIVKDGKAGLNRTTLPARIGGRKLKAGRYRLTAVARDGAGQVSVPKRTTFRVKK
jgi:hypothetical protein